MPGSSDVTERSVSELRVGRRGLGATLRRFRGTRSGGVEKTVDGSLSVTEADLSWVVVADGLRPSAAGFATTGRPGGPMLVEATQSAVLPLGSRILGLDVFAADMVPVRLEGLPCTVGPPRFDVPDDGSAPLARDTTRPDPGRPVWRRSPVEPGQAEITGLREVDDLLVADVTIRPLGWRPDDATVVLSSTVRWLLRYEPPKPPVRSPSLRLSKLDRRAGLGSHPGVSFDHDLQIDPTRLGSLPGVSLRPAENVDYLIVTDDVTWPETTAPHVPPTSAAAGAALPQDNTGLRVSDHFRRLAEWKTSRGLVAKVVTVTEILAGAYGDFTGGGSARDLQEVIRNFVIHAHTTWGVSYLLIGAAHQTVPVRRFLGHVAIPPADDDDTGAGWDVTRTGHPVPPVRRCSFLVSGKVVKMRFSPGLLDPTGHLGTGPLVAATTGRLIPFNLQANELHSGWFFVPQAELDDPSKTSNFTRLTAPTAEEDLCVVAVGQKKTVNDPYGFYWPWDNRLLPSDFYYASLTGPAYGQPGRHDFDPTNSGYYGQYHYDAKLKMERPLLDSWKPGSDVQVGRIPVRTAQEARQFVDKLLAYEQLRRPNGNPLDLNWLDDVAYIATNWAADTPDQVDDSVLQKETTRKHLRSWLPLFHDDRRSYEDAADLADPDVQTFDADAVRHLVNLMPPHVLSLTGHGSPHGCCGLNTDMPIDDHGRYAIVYANSCSTADPIPAEHCLGSWMVCAPGGAIAYVGNGAMSGTNGSELFEEKFWCALAALGRPGLSANLRAPSAGPASYWEHHHKAYYGCPEMLAWLDRPAAHVLDCPSSIKKGAQLTVNLHSPDGLPLAGHRVTAMAGWDGTRAAYLHSAYTDTNGQAHFPTSSIDTGPVRVTASQRGFIPVAQEVQLGS